MRVELLNGPARTRALKKLTSKYGLKDYMGELFINELLATWHQVPESQKFVVCSLGLYDAKRARANPDHN
jgi:hypothetical protein